MWWGLQRGVCRLGECGGDCRGEFVDLGNVVGMAEGGLWTWGVWCIWQRGVCGLGKCGGDGRGGFVDLGNVVGMAEASL